MTKYNIIEQLQSLNFICLDDDAEDRETWESIGKNGMKSFLTKKLGAKGYVSLKTRELYLKHVETGDYNDFHACAHFMMVDCLISHVAIGTKVELSLLIEQTLACSTDKNKDLINALESLIVFDSLDIAC